MNTPTCYRCNYDLTGLPPTHHCPECGAGYDELTRVWKPARPWKLGLGAALFGFYAFVSAGGEVLKMYSPLAKGAPNLIAVVLGVVTSAAGLIIPTTVILRAHRRNYRLATSPEGIFVRIPGKNEVIPWGNIVSVRRGELYSGRILRFSVTIERKGGKPISVYHILRSDKDVADFVSLCKKAQQIFTGHAEEAEVKAT